MCLPLSSCLSFSIPTYARLDIDGRPGKSEEVEEKSDIFDFDEAKRIPTLNTKKREHPE